MDINHNYVKLAIFIENQVCEREIQILNIPHDQQSSWPGRWHQSCFDAKVDKTLCVPQHVARAVSRKGGERGCDNHLQDLHGNMATRTAIILESNFSAMY